jgi:DNA repair protein RadA/Sms
MASKKEKTQFVCADCGETFLKWLGKCSSCGAFGTIKEFRESLVKKSGGIAAGFGVETADTVDLPNYTSVEVERMTTGFSQVDIVFGGGVVAGSVSLVAGSPGIGKSTLLLQIAAKMADNGKKLLYVSGEESIEQIALRAKRIFADKSPVKITTETSVEQILEICTKHKPDLLIVDSIQTIFSDETEGISGSVSQVRNCAAILTNFAKKTATAVVIIGHITKDGAIAGPRILEHIVDSVLSFEGEDFNRFRILRGQKNRFGASGEIAVFDMSASGLSEIRDTAKIFLNHAAASRFRVF